MRKILSLTLAGLGLFVLLASFSSAYYYAYPDNYNSYSYHSQRTSGWGPYASTKTTDYNRATTKFWDGYRWVEQTSYVKTTTDSPYGNYYAPYRGYNYYSPYGTRPWYQKYWSTPYQAYPRSYYYYSPY